MKNPPEVKPGDWITIGNRRCVVCRLYEPGSPLGLGLVVFDPKKPTDHDFAWDGERFVFPERGDFGGYAERKSELARFVNQLQGR